MASLFDDPALSAARNTAQTAATSASTEAMAGNTLADKLRSALNSKFTQDNPIIKDQEAARGDYLKMATQAPLNVTPRSAGGNADVIYNPLQQANLIQGYRAPGIARLATLNDLLGLATGGMENVIDATSRAHQGVIQQKQNEAQLARQAYTDLFGETQARLGEQQFNQKQAESGGGSDFTDLLALLAPHLFDQGQKEDKPQGLPVQPYEPIDPNKKYFSPGNQWYFDMNNGWLPVVD